MRFGKSWSRWAGAVPTGEVAFSADTAPTTQRPGPNIDRLAQAQVFSASGMSAQGVVVGVSAPAAAPTLTATLYAFEDATGLWHAVGAAVSITPGTLAYFPLPALLQDGGVDLILQVDDPGAVPAGQYVFSMGATASVPVAAGGGGGGTITSIVAGSGITIAGGTGPATTVTVNSSIQRATKLALEATLALVSGVVLATASVLSVATPGTNGDVFATVAGAPAWATPAGDVTGPPSAFVVGKINGATVSAAGALTTDHVLKVSGASATTYGFVANANVSTTAAIALSKLAFGAANEVVVTNSGGTSLVSAKIVDANIATGAAIDVAKLAAGTDTFVLTSTSGVTGWAAASGGSSVTWAGDLAGSNSTSQIVVSLTGATNVITIAATGRTLQWAAATTTPKLTQIAVASGTGADLTVAAQDAGSGTGGNALLLAGTATTKGYVGLGVNDGVGFAASGTVRLQKAASIRGLNNAGSASINLASFDSTDVITYGGTQNAGLIFGTTTGATILTQINSATVTTVQVGTAVVAALKVNAGVLNASLVLELQTNAGTLWQFGADVTSTFMRGAGTTSTIGQIRFANNLGTLIGTRTGASADYAILSAGSNFCVVGSTVGLANAVATTYLTASASLVGYVGGVVWNSDSAGFTFNTKVLLGTGASSLVVDKTLTPVWAHTAQSTDTPTFDWTLRAQTAGGSTNAGGGALLLQGGNRFSTSGRRRGIRVSLAASDAALLEVTDVQAEVTSPSRAVVLNRAASITATEMPTGTGDLVVYEGECAAEPTVSPVSGALRYVSGGAFYGKTTSGLQQTLLGPLASRTWPSDANYTAVLADYRARIIKLTGGSLSASRNFVIPLTSGYWWIIRNETTGSVTPQSIVAIGASGTGITILNGTSAIVFADGTNIIGAAVAL